MPAKALRRSSKAGGESRLKATGALCRLAPPPRSRARAEESVAREMRTPTNAEPPVIGARRRHGHKVDAPPSVPFS
eukprot:161029-Lingulodinium_polyedra.AAC.1